MSLERIVEHLIMVSDNDAAEVIYRQAAVGAGRPGSIAEANKVVRSELTQLGIWQQGMSINDGSGMARQTKVSADSMAKMLRAAAEQQHPELRAVITGLSVAGVEGSLKRRYGDDQSLPRVESSVPKPERSTRCAVSPESYAPQMARCWHSRS